MGGKKKQYKKKNQPLVVISAYLTSHTTHETEV